MRLKRIFMYVLAWIPIFTGLYFTELSLRSWQYWSILLGVILYSSLAYHFGMQDSKRSKK